MKIVLEYYLFNAVTLLFFSSKMKFPTAYETHTLHIVSVIYHRMVDDGISKLQLKQRQEKCLSGIWSCRTGNGCKTSLNAMYRTCDGIKNVCGEVVLCVAFFVFYFFCSPCGCGITRHHDGGVICPARKHRNKNEISSVSMILCFFASKILWMTLLLQNLPRFCE